MIDPQPLLRAVCLPRIDPESLTEAWRQAHFAAQAAAELGKGWAHEQPDDSNSSFLWRGVDDSLEGAPTVTKPTLTARLGIRDLLLSIHDDAERTIDASPATGSTVNQLTAWVRSIAKRELGPERQPARPAPDLPDHPLADGDAFPDPNPALEQLAAIYNTADRLLGTIAQQQPAFTAPRCWPHHFDHAALAIVDRCDDGQMSKSIGVGVTPPDPLEPAGYWYVSPWSRDPAPVRLPPTLIAGRWHARDGAPPMAVLPTNALAVDDDATRSELLSEFLAQAINAAHAMLTS